MISPTCIPKKLAILLLLFASASASLLAQPVGSFDGLSSGNSLFQNQTLAGSGWAADDTMGAPVSEVDIQIDGNVVCQAGLGGYRPDVQDANINWGFCSPFDITYSGWSFSYNIGQLSPGSHTVTAVAYDDSGFSANIGGSETFTVSAVPPPVGAFDGLSSGGSLFQNQTLAGSGWAADYLMGAPVSEVDIQIDGNVVCQAGLGGYRPDVQYVNLNGGNWSPLDITYSGWSFSYNIGQLSPGSHTVTAIAYDDSGLSTNVGSSQTFTVSAAPPPVGAFDGLSSGGSLFQNQTLAGSGWAADYLMGAPVSEVDIQIDGNVVCQAGLGGYRPDVQAANMAGGFWSPLDITDSGWNFSYNIGQLSPGSHTVTAIAHDDSGLSTNIGSSQAFTVIAENPLPVGAFDGLSSSSLSQNQTLTGSGWAADYLMGAPVSEVDIQIDGNTVCWAGLGGSRPDVQAANMAWGFWSPLDITLSGWNFSYCIGQLSFGSHTVTAVAYNNMGFSANLGSSQTFTVISTPPTTNSIVVGDTTIGQNVYIHGRATDPDGDLALMGLYVEGPGLPQWTFVQNATLSGADDTATFVWAPPSPGTYMVHIRASDSQGNPDSNANVTASFIVYPGNSYTVPNGSFDGISNANSTVSYGESNVVATGWAADPTDGTPVDRVEMQIDGKYAGNATLGGWRQDVADAYGRSDYGNSGWSFSFPVETLSPGAHTMSATVFNSRGLSNYLGSKDFTVSRRFQILIDVNQLKLSEANSANFSQLAADGVWSIPINSGWTDENGNFNGDAIPYYTADGIQAWRNILAMLNASKRVVTEDNPDQTLGIDYTSYYLNRMADGAMFYYEGRPSDNTTLTIDEIASRAGHDVSLLGQDYGQLGARVIVHSRSTNDPGDIRVVAVNTALGQPNCSGIVFETIPSQAMKQYATNQAVTYAISAAHKDCYIILAPSMPTTDYLNDVKGIMSYWEQSGMFGSRKLYIVLAVYVRPKSNVGFLTGDNSTGDDNSVLAVVNWLKQYRNYQVSP
jgi:hypothetical protein